MKKISVLIMLILCVTIGGVYAAWTYSGDTFSGVDRTVSHGMTTATEKGDAGILSIGENTVDIAVDQTAEGDYTAKLDIKGSISVVFTPNPGSDPADYNGLKVIATLFTENAEANMYPDVNGVDKPIYVYSGNSVTVDLVEVDGVLTATLNQSDIDTLLDLGGEFVLDQYSEYEAFHAKEGRITLTVLFTPVAPAAQD